jgi:hypothetical protein
MKNIWKVLAAMMVVALPFVVSSCGSDDEDNGPWDYNYSWTMTETNLPGNPTAAEKQAALAAEATLSQNLAAAFQKQGFSVDVNKQTFTKAQTTDAVSIWDSKAKSAVYAVKGVENYLESVEALPASARLIVRRGGDEIYNERIK